MNKKANKEEVRKRKSEEIIIEIDRNNKIKYEKLDKELAEKDPEKAANLIRSLLREEEEKWKKKK